MKNGLTHWIRMGSLRFLLFYAIVAQALIITSETRLISGVLLRRIPIGLMGGSCTWILRLSTLVINAMVAQFVVSKILRETFSRYKPWRFIIAVNSLGGRIY